MCGLAKTSELAPALAYRVTTRLSKADRAAKDQVNAVNAVRCDAPGDAGMLVIRPLEQRLQGSTHTVNHTTLVGVIKELWPNPSGGVDDSYDVAILDNQLNLADYAIDAAVAAEGLIVTYWVA